MLKFTVLTVIAAVALCEDLDALQNVDINKLLESLQSQIELTQLGETQHKGTIIDSDDDQYDRYGSLTDQQLQNFLLQVSNDKTPKPKAVSFKSPKSVGPKVQDDEFKKVLESTLMDFSNGGKPKEYNRFDDKINSYGIKDAKQKSDLSLIHQLLTKEDDRIRNQKPNKNHDYPVVNEKLSNHILGKLLKYKKDTLEKRSKEKMLENMLRDTSQVIALVQDSSEENQGNDKVDLDDTDDYSKVYVVLNSEAVKSSANKNKLNALLNSLLSPPRSQKKSQGKYKGFLLNETVEGLQQRRRGGSDDDDMDGGRESYMPKRQSGGGGRGGGGGGRGRGGGGGGRGGGGGGRGGGGGGGGGGRGGRGRGKAGRGGGGGGYTAIPYMNHRGNIYENEKY